MLNLLKSISYTAATVSIVVMFTGWALVRYWSRKREEEEAELDEFEERISSDDLHDDLRKSEIF